MALSGAIVIDCLLKGNHAYLGRLNLQEEDCKRKPTGEQEEILCKEARQEGQDRVVTQYRWKLVNALGQHEVYCVASITNEAAHECSS